MINLTKGDLIILKSTNNPGFVCSQGKFVFFNKMIKDKYECSIHVDKTDYILISEHQINAAFDSLTNIKIYQHDPSDGL